MYIQKNWHSSTAHQEIHPRGIFHEPSWNLQGLQKNLPDKLVVSDLVSLSLRIQERQSGPGQLCSWKVTCRHLLPITYQEDLVIIHTQRGKSKVFSKFLCRTWVKLKGFGKPCREKCLCNKILEGILILYTMLLLIVNSPYRINYSPTLSNLNHLDSEPTPKFPPTVFAKGRSHARVGAWIPLYIWESSTDMIMIW